MTDPSLPGTWLYEAMLKTDEGRAWLAFLAGFLRGHSEFGTAPDGEDKIYLVRAAEVLESLAGIRLGRNSQDEKPLPEDVTR
jgi:hypothetical protein